MNEKRNLNGNSSSGSNDEHKIQTENQIKMVRNARIHTHTEPQDTTMKVLRMKEKQQNNKNIGIMNVHQLDPFLSIILHTESVLCAKHASNHN